MTTSAHTSFASEPPFLVPCPPPALRLPPHVFRTPPAVQRSGSKSIPLPPIGARIPGDRIVWTLRVLAGAIAATAPFPAPECELAGTISEYDPSPESRQEGKVKLIRESGDAVGKSSEAEESAAEAFEESDSPTPGEKNEFPGEIEPGREIRLRGNSIQISALADIIGIKGYEILRGLIDMGIFAKATDLITADTANEISKAYGFEIVVGGRSGASKTEPTDSTQVSRAYTRGDAMSGLGSQFNVRAGTWIRDSTLGLGRILALNTDPEKHDRYRVWFVGKSSEGRVVENHFLLPGLLGVIDKSMIPKDILDAAPEIDL